MKGLKDMKTTDGCSNKLVPASLSGMISQDKSHHHHHHHHHHHSQEKSQSPLRNDKVCEETFHSDHSDHKHSFVRPDPPQDIQERIDLLDDAYQGEKQKKKGIKLLMGLTSSELYHKKS